MEHTNLFLFENQAAFEAVYPDDKVDTPIPGVAYVRASGDDEASTYYNRMVTNYSITIHSKNKSGETVAQDYSVQTPNVLDGNDVKMNIVANPVEGYKPRYAVEKVEFTSASTEHTVIYLAATSYTVTVHHVFSGETLTADTEVLVNNIFEEDVVRVKIEPENIAGYKADPVYISVSGDMEYTLEYEEGICYVDLGLPSGTLWACKNLGAGTPEDIGNLYAWGEVATKSEYTESNYKWYDSATDTITKYNDTDGLYELEAEDDAANFNLGGEWHMPTLAQFYELQENTTVSVDGDYVTLTSTQNGKTLTFPVSSYYGYGTEYALSWTSERNIVNSAYVIQPSTGSGDAQVSANDTYRYPGIPVRPVLGDSPESEPSQEEVH